jgi:transcriptional regulator with XRE-family HTH domain
MDLQQIYARIERRLQALGMSANAASKAAKKPDAIRNIKRAIDSGGRQGVSTSTLAALARVLKTTQAWLTDGTGPETPNAEELAHASLPGGFREEATPFHAPARTEPPGAPLDRSEMREQIRTKQQQWLQGIINLTGLNPSQMASRANVSDTTITRLLNNPRYKGTLQQETIERLKATYNVPGPEEFSGKAPFLVGFAEAERIELDREGLAQVAGALGCQRNSVIYWRLKTPAIEQVGYLPGDILAVDLQAQAAPQDVVCAVYHDRGHGADATIWRVYDPPFLVGASHDRTAFKPMLVDNHQVTIRGVVIASMRPHPLSKLR